MDRSPCIGCDLENEDKNSRRCMECEARCNYVESLGGLSCGIPVENTDLVAHSNKESPRPTGGRASRLTDEDVARGIEEGYIVKTEHTAEKKNPTAPEDQVEETIKEICAEHNVEVSKLKAGGRRHNYTSARKAIARRLIENYGLSKTKIGELTGVSVSSIWHLLNKKKKTTDAVDILHKRYIGDDPERKASLQTERKKTESKPAKTVTIDFSGHAEILEQLEKYAKEEIRTVEDQVLYFVKEAFEEKAEADGNQG